MGREEILLEVTMGGVVQLALVRPVVGREAEGTGPAGPPAGLVVSSGDVVQAVTGQGKAQDTAPDRRARIAGHRGQWVQQTAEDGTAGDKGGQHKSPQSLHLVVFASNS